MNLFILTTLVCSVGVQQGAAKDAVEADVLESTFKGLNLEVNRAGPALQRKKPLRFAVGVNSAVDLIVSGTALMAALEVAPPSNVLHETLTSLQDLGETFAYSFSSGQAFERILADADLYKQIVAAAESLAEKDHFTGGNAALIGQHLVETANGNPRTVRLVSGVGPKLKELLHPNIDVPAESMVEEDEVHLILEYALGETWGEYTAPRANRFIFSFDRTNAELKPLDNFATALEGFDATNVVLSGVHMLEGEPAAFRKERVEATRDFLAGVDAATPTHLELASLADPAFVKLIANNLVGTVDSLGLNEQELKLLAKASHGPHKSIYSSEAFENPPIDVVADLVHFILVNYGKAAFLGGSTTGRLSRVHFHTLSFHLIGVERGAWRFTAAAAAWGSMTCSERACKAGSTFEETGELAGRTTLRFPSTFALHKLHMGQHSKMSDTEPDGDGPAALGMLAVEREFDPKRPMTTWRRGIYDFALVPVLVCTPPEKTVGLGDSISAAGLELHQFIPKDKRNPKSVRPKSNVATAASLDGSDEEEMVPEGNDDINVPDTMAPDYDRPPTAAGLHGDEL
eukprot:gene8064-157_t